MTGVRIYPGTRFFFLISGLGRLPSVTPVIISNWIFERLTRDEDEKGENSEKTLAKQAFTPFNGWSHRALIEGPGSVSEFKLICGGQKMSVHEEKRL